MKIEYRIDIRKFSEKDFQKYNDADGRACYADDYGM